MVLERLDSHTQKKETGPLSDTTHGNELEMDADLNIRPETPKLLEENTGGQLLDRHLGSFGGHDTRSTGDKSKINK